MLWQKQTLYERVTRSPAFVVIPGVTDQGVETTTLTEHVDIFPTILDALGLPPVQLCSGNSRQETLCTEGVSLLPLVSHPEEPLKDMVFTHVRRLVRNVVYLGIGLRVPEYRYVEWPQWNDATGVADWDNQAGKELYDRVNDPEEDFNVVDDPAYSAVVADLSKVLRAGWRGLS